MLDINDPKIVKETELKIIKYLASLHNDKEHYTCNIEEIIPLSMFGKQPCHFVCPLVKHCGAGIKVEMNRNKIAYELYKSKINPQLELEF